MNVSNITYKIQQQMPLKLGQGYKEISSPKFHRFPPLLQNHHVQGESGIPGWRAWNMAPLFFPWKQNTIIHLAKLLYFTNLGFPEIRGIPFLTYLLGWGHEKCVSFISPINLIFAEENWRFGILPKPKLQKEVFKLLKQPAWVVQEPS